MAEARQAVGFKLAVKPDGKIEIDWSSGRKYSRHVVRVELLAVGSRYDNLIFIL